MAEELSSYDKVDHLKTQFSDWEALSIHEADPICSEDSSFQSDSEENDDPRSLSNSKSRPSGLGDRYDLTALRLDTRRRGSGVSEAPMSVTDKAPKSSRDESEATGEHQNTEPPQGYSLSATSSAVESLTRPSSPKTPLSPTNPVGTDAPKQVVRFTDRALAKRPAVSRRSSVNTVPLAEWGVLFDEKGYATIRNGQFLKGVAKHVINDLAPSSNNLVVTPEKLSVLYSKYRLDSEIYPFTEVFNSRARDAHDRLADFFTDLDCQYHLVQPDSNSRPRVPALTPIGFAQFLTTCILAHPDEEFRRLDKIVSDVQLVADGEPEKLPRQLLRSDFPVRHDPKSRKVLAAALDDLIYDLKLLELPTPKKPLAIMPPPSSDRRSTMPIPGVRHYVPPESLYTRKDAYVSSAAGEASKNNRQSLTPSLKTATNGRTSAAHLDTQNRDRDRYDDQAGTRYAEEPDSYEPASSTAAMDQQYRSGYTSSTDIHPPPGRSTAVARASQTGPIGTTARTVHVCSYPSATPGGCSTSIYRPTGTSTSTSTSPTTYRRAQSPPSRSYRASAPDVKSTSASYFGPTGYLPASTPAPGDRREPAGSPERASSGTVVDTSHRGAYSRRASSSGVLEGGASTALTARGTGAVKAGATTPTTPVSTTTSLLVQPSSPPSSPAAPSASHQRHPRLHSRSHSHQESTGNRRTTSTPFLPLPLTMTSTAEKKHTHSRDDHHHHRRRRSAIVTVDDDKGPTWEEVLRGQPSQHHRSGSGTKGSHHHHHHRHHSGY
ncbi:hypothetical protein F5Y05DRAFT_420020 [Hypoxylon sp. FL0543]|nr:hypothetical protein F5Y05DRAFT_420020 [Hypoxylon sp. FL0543]